MFFTFRGTRPTRGKKFDVFTIDARFEKHSECYIVAEYRKHFVLYDI